MRKNPTDAESVVWSWLRNRRFGGWKFRRQHPVANYILDFYCEELHLAIELDGSLHRQNRDQGRDRVLEWFGIQVVRIRNETILQRPEEAESKIANAISTLSPRERVARSAG